MNNMIGKPKSSLDTPCLVVDNILLQENIQKLQHEANHAKKNVRPHVKTHKCSSISALQIKYGAMGISAAKVSEAYVLAKNGFKNTLITSPVVTETKIRVLMECLHHDPDIIVVVDNLENVAELNAFAKNQNQILSILIDLDPHVGRTGIAFDDAVQFAHALTDFSHINLAGIQCYAGNLQHITNYQDREKASTDVMTKAANVMRELKTSGYNCDILSGSGTGTYYIDLLHPDVTEIQPGSYTMMDAEYSAIGSHEHPTQYKKFKPALTLLSTVISVNHGMQVTCDAGWKALYEVPTKPIILQPEGYEYSWFGDEHGKITPVNHTTLPMLGDRLELMVAHCDPTINMYDEIFVTENDVIIDVWPVDMRGKGQ